MHYQFTDEADAALDAILHYIARDSRKSALSVYEHIAETCEMLADMPNLGRRPTFASDPELLYYPTKKYQSYLIFFHKRKSGIIVVDIIHGVRDLPDLFTED